jgi:hypothetical protein
MKYCKYCDIFIFKVRNFVRGGHCNYSPRASKENLPTPLLTILSISVLKMHPNINFSSLSRSVKWSVSTLLHHRNSVCLNFSYNHRALLTVVIDEIRQMLYRTKLNLVQFLQSSSKDALYSCCLSLECSII